MNNHKILPYERNRYFYGKLLTVRDFEIEQRYFNDKRRLLNRLLVGPGLLAGLNVLAVDDKTLLVEPGVALDYLGREIVLEAPFISRLSVIDGFDQITDQTEAYLSVRYDESQKEAVHNISANTEHASGQSEYNRVAEGYKLCLTTEQPSTAHQLESLIASHVYTLVETQELSIRLTLPIAASMSEAYPVHLDIIKKKATAPITLNLILNSRYINFGQDMVLDFDERTVATAGQYQLDYQFEISPVQPQDDLIHVKSFEVSAEPLRQDKPKDAFTHAVALSNLCFTSILENKYKQMALDDLMSASADDLICLAKIKLLKTDKTYVIERVEPDPLNQLIFNLPLSQLMRSKAKQRTHEPSVTAENIASPQQSAPAMSDVSVSTGKISFEFKRKVNAKEKFYSVETKHDLGTGEVFIELAVDSETREGDSNFGYQNQLVFGDFEIFEKSNLEPAVPMLKTAAICYKNKGSFVVGIQFLEPYHKDELVIRWKATKVHRQYNPLHKGNGLTIEPAMSKIKTRDQLSFNVFYENEPINCIWKVKDPNGGEIDQSGVYMSPSLEGVFEIIAEIPERHETLSAYVVVENE